MKGLSLLKMASIALVFCAAAAIASAQTLTTLYSFCAQTNCTDGSTPYAGLVQGTDGNLYGATELGGTVNTDYCLFGCGTVFQITLSGTLTTLYSFDETDGAFPYAGLLQGTDGDLYGTTEGGGPVGTDCNFGCGTVFKITTRGILTTLYTMNFHIGYFPYAGLVQVAGDFYGTAYGGGYFPTSDCGDLDGFYLGCGTVFRITQTGIKTGPLYDFRDNPNNTDGSWPYGRLVEATDGNLYGTTFSGATVFKITPSGGILTTLHRFEGTDGAAPYAGLVQASDKNFYGTTSMGGTGANGGTVFKITPLGTLTTLYNFCAQTNCADGSAPWADLVQGTDGDFYGTTNSGGGYGFGSVFKITPSGILTTLHSFDGTDGAWPRAALVQTTDGNFYGTTTAGGNLNCNAPHGCGTVFKLSLGLGPFVETVPTSGKVGATVHILGTNLTGATSVSFNGTVATFTTVSATALRTTVPTGATTGIVTVTTPSGTLNSNVAFRVSP